LEAMGLLIPMAFFVVRPAGHTYLEVQVLHRRIPLNKRAAFSMQKPLR